ncbi:inositol-pentakisphosphate 2-kinase [Coniella lustricola]|uniref:Inositol-pentakisphosphate 2-kinase n=1 Tax=Coniella lustricola TaxID=2025994 RepID=A0A2T3AEA7_9PEZI|nr:inositol-pentakisphosphate 2-kinase [Coniella lustricola]
MEAIPARACCKFVGEGRANVVFSITGADGHLNLQGQLLRVPKQTSNAYPYSRLQQYWETEVLPRFGPQDLVQQRLVRLPSEKAFFERLNQQLHMLDARGLRRRDFMGQTVSFHVQYGMLVDDMRAETARHGPSTMHEIKPKWLAQSPRAPRGAHQCRNCARELWRNMKNKTRTQVFCPLNLVKAADFPDEDRVAADVGAALIRCHNVPEAEARILTAWLRTCTLFKRLRRVQWENDHRADIKDEGGYCLAMTLRDCSLFVVAPTKPDVKPHEVVAKLGDMDMKNFAAKKEYWSRMEQEFHDSGVYWNDTALARATTDCQLPFYKARRDLSDELRRYYVDT